MPYALLISLALVAFIPAMARAEIYSHTSASSNTGGNTAGPGGVVRTGGASASVSTTNAHGTSTSSVYIKTDANGTVHEESYESASGDVSVSVQSTPKETVIETKQGAAPAVKKVIPAEADAVRDGDNDKASASAQAEFAEPPAPSEPAPGQEGTGIAALILNSLRSLVAGFFSWFS
jgi:hypothetical protein